MDKKSIAVPIVVIAVGSIITYLAGGLIAVIAYDIWTVLWTLCVYYLFIRPLKREIQ